MSASFFYGKFLCYVLHGRDIAVGVVPERSFIGARQAIIPHPPKATVGSFYAIIHPNFSSFYSTQTFHKQKRPTRSKPSQKLTERI